MQYAVNTPFEDGKRLKGIHEKEAIQWNKHSAFAYGQSLSVHAQLSCGIRDLLFGQNIYQLLHVTHASGEGCGSCVYAYRLVYAHACRFSDT